MYFLKGNNKISGIQIAIISEVYDGGIHRSLNT